MDSAANEVAARETVLETDTESPSESGTETVAETDAESDTETVLETGTGTLAESGTETGFDSDKESVKETDVESDTKTGTETLKGSDAESDTETGKETKSESPAESGKPVPSLVVQPAATVLSQEASTDDDGQDGNAAAGLGWVYGVVAAVAVAAIAACIFIVIWRRRKRESVANEDEQEPDETGDLGEIPADGSSKPPTAEDDGLEYAPAFVVEDDEPPAESFNLTEQPAVIEPSAQPLVTEQAHDQLVTIIEPVPQRRQKKRGRTHAAPEEPEPVPVEPEVVETKRRRRKAPTLPSTFEGIQAEPAVTMMSSSAPDGLTRGLLSAPDDEFAPAGRVAPSPSTPSDLKRVGDLGATVDVGEIRGRAGQPTVESIRLPFQAAPGTRFESKLHCPDVPGVTVGEVRAVGDGVEVQFAIDSARHGESQFRLKLDGPPGKSVELAGKVIIELPTPVIIHVEAPVGERATVEIPTPQDFWAKAQYTARLETKGSEFWLSENKGVIEAGAKVLPFKVTFAPQNRRPVEALIIVEIGEVEYAVKICGSTGRKR